MNIKNAFKNKAFIPYLMAGDPSLEKTREYILALQSAGADLIELGVPFSDPIAEGETIQKANLRAFAGGATFEGVLKLVESLKGELTVPLFFMSYLNPIFHYGYEPFFKRCRDIGAAGVIVPDLPFEEQGEVKEAARKYEIAVITLIAPTSESRAAEAAKRAEGYIYLVSSLGVTGVRAEFSSNLEELVKIVRESTDIPIAVGFGVHEPAQARELSKIADGVIVGSAIVNIIAKYGEEAAEPLIQYVKAMKEALNS